MARKNSTAHCKSFCKKKARFFFIYIIQIGPHIFKSKIHDLVDKTSIQIYSYKTYARTHARNEGGNYLKTEESSFTRPTDFFKKVKKL